MIKLVDLATLMEADDNKQGTYAAVKFSTATKNNIKKWCTDNKIPNCTRSDKLHTTLLYSRKELPDYVPAGKIDPPWIGVPTKFDVWESQPDSDGNKTRCLVLQYDCPELSARHDKLMKEHDATWDYPDYKPHITFSYNIGEIELDDIDDVSSIGDLEIVIEYGEPLDLDWAKTKSTT